MGRARRLERLERELSLLEAEFRLKLLAALEECAAGKWGLFGKNDEVLAHESKQIRERLKSESATVLIEIGEKILEVRRQLGMTDQFALYERFSQLRASRGPNTPGELTLAQTWLDELKQE